MHVTRTFGILSLVCLLFPLVLCGESDSDRRIASGIRQAKRLIESNGKQSRAAVLSGVRSQLVREYPVLGHEPTEALITEIESLRNYPQRFEAILNKRHPVLSEMELNYLAEKRYPLYKLGDHVKVYYVRGNQIESWSGRLSGIEEGRINVGARWIFFRDMEPVEGNDHELLKYRPEDNARERAAYKVALQRETSEKREDFRQNRHRDVEAMILAQDQALNEQHGYTLYKKSWLTPRQLFERIVSSALEELEDARYEVLNRKLKGRRESLASVERVQDLRLSYELPGTVENPGLMALRDYELKQDQARVAKLERRRREEAQAAREKREAAVRAEQAKQAAAQAAAEKARLAAEAKKKAAEEAKAKAAEEERLAAAEAAAAEKEARLAAKKAQEEREAAEAAAEAERRAREMKVDKYTPIVIGLVVFVLIMAMCLFLFLRHKRKEETDPFAKFFEGKGKLQKDFWSQATADPEHFKYVAYMFPNLEEATKALGRLSYMRPEPGGSVRCTRDLNFGVYPHLDGAVCFVGGVKFSYALWREASAVLPELPNAQYFKVSTEPIVQLLLPDLDKLSSDKHVHVESLGVEEGEGDNGEFNRLYRYRTDSRDEAMDFLENFNIHEAGIIVHVETPDGIYGKDENGVFTLENTILQ